MSPDRQSPTKKAGPSVSSDDDNPLPTLLDIFQFLDSPDPQPYVDVCLSSEYADIFRECLSSNKYLGMRSQLYQYQRNSLFKMLKRELLPDMFLDPDYKPLRKADRPQTNSKMLRHPLLPYIQFATGFDRSVNEWTYRHCNSTTQQPVSGKDVSWYGDTRGGIICEDMGTGKTCECLALVLLTKRQMARPPTNGESIPGVGIVSSDVTSDFMPRQAVTLPSLKHLAACTLLVSCVESLRVMHDDGELSDHLWNQLRLNPSYYWINPMGETSQRPNRRRSSGIVEEHIFFKVYMSSSTIVVVPDNLVDQWVREKYKHIEDAQGLEMLKIDDSTNNIPEPQTLIRYDIVLVSMSRLSKEYIPIDARIHALQHKCRCRVYGGSKHKCTCIKQRVENASYRSPLLRVHWKRLIVDEGHIMSSRNTARSLMAAYLIADRRWVCTGTPTHNLIHATTSITSEERGGLKTASSPRRRHNIDTSSDFIQLGSLVSKFLRIEPFAQTTSAWATIMVQPYRRGDPGARDRIRALMQNIMVRNHPETVNIDLQLPPLFERTVVLPPTRHQMLTYNTIVAFFHINAILTEREGRDYFFHPDNKKHLRQIVGNLFGACSWFWVNPKHIQDGIKNGKQAVELWQQSKKPYTDSDVQLLKRSIEWLEQVSEDSEWKYLTKIESVGYWITGLPEKLTTDMYCCSDSPLPRLAAGYELVNIASNIKHMLTIHDNRLPPSPRNNLSSLEYEQLKQSQITGCTNNKSTYIINQVLRYHKSEKCIVFANSQREVALISDGLKLARIPHLIYANQLISRSQRRHNITTFSTSYIYNTIVMDVHLAAYGIDLSAASRAWFLSPIWQAAKERQAIKRAHRLGQQNPVYVETLLTAGSVEEALWQRRQEISANEGDVAVTKDVEEDGKMRGLLSNAKFIDGCGSGSFASDFKPVQSTLKYPGLLRHMYEMWRPESPANASPAVPFFKTKKLKLRLPPPQPTKAE